MPVDKQILYQYIDACELIRETEEEIRRIKRQRLLRRFTFAVRGTRSR